MTCSPAPHFWITYTNIHLKLPSSPVIYINSRTRPFSAQSNNPRLRTLGEAAQKQTSFLSSPDPVIAQPIASSARVQFDLEGWRGGLLLFPRQTRSPSLQYAYLIHITCSERYCFSQCQHTFCLHHDDAHASLSLLASKTVVLEIY